MLFSHPTQHIFRVPLCWGALPGYIGFRATVFGISSLGNLQSCNISHQLGVQSKRRQRIHRGYTGFVYLYVHLYTYIYIHILQSYVYMDV